MNELSYGHKNVNVGNVVFIEPVNKYGSVIAVKSFIDYLGDKQKCYQINFSNDFNILRNPSLLNKAKWFDKNFNEIDHFKLILFKDDDDIEYLIDYNNSIEIHDLNRAYWLKTKKHKIEIVLKNKNI